MASDDEAKIRALTDALLATTQPYKDRPGIIAHALTRAMAMHLVDHVIKFSWTVESIDAVEREADRLIDVETESLTDLVQKLLRDLQRQ